MAKKTIYLSGSTAKSPKKKNFYKTFGILVFIFSGFQLYSYVMEQTYFEFSPEFLLEFASSLNFWNTLVLFCISIGFIFTGFTLTGRKTNQYIRFEKDKITYKPSYLKDTKSINIDDLKEMVFSPMWVLCISEKEKFMIDLSWVPVHVTKKIKERLKVISDKKQIPIKGQEK